MNVLTNDVFETQEGLNREKLQAIAQAISAFGNVQVTGFSADASGTLTITLQGGATLTATPHDPTKQNLLTFDQTPTEGSGNPVTSGGVFTALGTKLDEDEYRNFTGATSTGAGESGIVPAPGTTGLYLDSGGSWEAPDDTPREGSGKPVTSGGVFTALGTKQDLMTPITNEEIDAICV